MIAVGAGGVARALRNLKKTYNEDVAVSVRRHQEFVGPGERRRFKAKRARKRLKRGAERRAEVLEVGPARRLPGLPAHPGGIL